MKRPRVVITGMGAVSSLGSSVKQLWENLLKGRSGVRRITQFDASDLPCQIAGEVSDFDPLDYMERKVVRRNPRSAQMALAAAIQAVKDALLPKIMPEPERSGVAFGTAMGGIDRAIEGIDVLRTQGINKVNPFYLPSAIPNLSAYLIANQFRCLGPNTTITTACATSTQAIGEGAEYIRRGAVDVVISGGTEALVLDFAIAGFAVMRALPTNFNDNPTKASRPFDAKREGFIFSEGAGVLVLENLDHALGRGARIYAEVAGHASSTDGFSLAAPDPDGIGPMRAMRWALDDAQVTPKDVDYINAHGSSTPLNDVMETKAIKGVFGERAYDIPVSSTKSMLGHAMGASGALETIACTLAIQDGMLPPTINYEVPDPECDLNYVPNQAQESTVDVALNNSFGLGGQNACLVIKRYQE